MGWYGRQVEKLFGQRLPAFANHGEAEAYLFRRRDQRLKRLAEIAESSETFSADFSPESLKTLEGWYFDLWERNGFRSLGISVEEFECCMASYFGEVAVRNCPDATWAVQEYAFERGKYEIGVRRGLASRMLSRFTDHHKQQGNKKREKIYREYLQLFS